MTDLAEVEGTALLPLRQPRPSLSGRGVAQLLGDHIPYQLQICANTNPKSQRADDDGVTDWC